VGAGPPEIKVGGLGPRTPRFRHLCSGSWHRKLKRCFRR